MHGFLASTPVGVGADGGPALARAQSMLAATCPQCVNKYAYRVVGGPDLSSACGTKRTCGPETIVGRFRGRADMAGPACRLDPVANDPKQTWTIQICAMHNATRNVVG